MSLPVYLAVMDAKASTDAVRSEIEAIRREVEAESTERRIREHLRGMDEEGVLLERVRKKAKNHVLGMYFTERVSPDEEEIIRVESLDVFEWFYQAYLNAKNDYIANFGDEFMAMRGLGGSDLPGYYPGLCKQVSFHYFTESQAKKYQEILGRGNMPASFLQAVKEQTSTLTLADLISSLGSYMIQGYEAIRNNSPDYADTMEFREYYAATGFCMAVVDVMKLVSKNYMSIVSKWKSNPNTFDLKYATKMIPSNPAFLEMTSGYKKTRQELS